MIKDITSGQDMWWLSPAMVLLFGALGLGYLIWAAMQGVFYEWGPYTSPVYSAPYVPEWWKLSPAFLLLWIPAGFRLTCYYGRKTYYRAAFGDPIACAVEEPYRKNYTGESRFPFVLQNLHRYFLYPAVALLLLHWVELILSISYQGQLYFGLGTLIILLDTIALSFYVFGCHSLRHLIGGKGRAFTCCRHALWKKVSLFNAFHNRWFWISLFTIGIADLYIRLLAMGIISADPHMYVSF